MGYIKLNKKSFFHNLDYFSAKCGTKDKLAIALKDNAYGHGIEQISLMCKEYGIKNVFVRNLSEASIAKKYRFETILMLYDIPELKDDSIVISINSIECLKKVPKQSKIELKIDTGMNRNGIDTSEITKALELIEKNDLILNGLFTHFCCADEDNNITTIQEKKFLSIIPQIKETITYDFKIHCANSAGVHKVDMDMYDMARIGIGAYGYLDLKEEKYLKPILSLYANKITTKKLKKDEHIGYGSCAYIVPFDMTVSNYDIGYGDGLFRIPDDTIAYIANDKKILGRISMDSFSCIGDDEEVCVFNNVTHLANIHKTIKYEILTNLKANIKRVIVDF
ncbi:MAG: alanine racemase [Campylobacterota bacterium]|nr:alanine racemase [Campylobacterota bacterium]